MKHTLSYISVLLCMLLASSCQDDYWNEINGYYGDGTGRVSLEIDFEPMAAGDLQSRSTVTPPGDGFGNLDDLVILIFDKEGKFVEYHDIADISSKIKETDRTDADASNGHLAGEKRTASLALDLTLSSGQYYIYAVANMGHYESSVRKTSTLDALRELGIESMTREQFRNIRRTWDAANYRNNREMCGIFTSLGRDSEKVNAYTGMPENPVSIGPGARVHCWLRRLASKITVDFDASALASGTTVWIKEVRVKDVPFDCSLMERNTVESTERSVAHGLSPDSDPNSKWSHHIQFASDDATGLATNDHEKWPALTASDSTLAEIARKYPEFAYLAQLNHSDSAPAIFFYENMQGIGESKLQDADNNGIIDSPDSYKPGAEHYKDNKPCGTYVEVVAFYESFDAGNESSGEIIYRFMLGKDVIDNYDVERNHHYRLTMCLRGYANDVDWHIEYDYTKQPVLTVPTPYYISYGYNESMELPLRIMGKLVGDTIRADIVRNDWWPSVMWEDRPSEKADFLSPSNTYYLPSDKDSVYYGFLSLRRPHGDVIGKHRNSNTKSDNAPYYKNIWEGTTDGRADNVDYIRNEFGGKRPLGTRVYRINDDDPKGAKVYSYDENTYEHDGEYRVYVAEPGTENTPRQTTVYLPMYTRQRNLIKNNSFTGENPYISNQRRSKVRLRFKVKDLDGITHPVDTVIDIIQVAKIGNPLAIWRDWNDCQPFKVTLKYLASPSATTFTDLTSHEGGWSAEVEQGKEWILLNGGKRKITGNKGDKIEFTYRPSGILSNPNKCRYGLIKVLYHNFSCVHYIYVRQGYAPTQIIDGNTWWHTFNLVSNTEEAKSPCDEGSLFKYMNLDDPIASENQVNDKTPWINYDQKSFKDHANTEFVIAGTGGQTKKLWKNISSKDFTEKNKWPDVVIGGKTYHIASIDNMTKLRDGGPNRDTRHQYGVLYDGSSTVTASTIDDAFGYKTGTTGKGMRGSIVYNRVNARQIFFPIGSTGYGKRKQKGSGKKYDASTIPAELGWASGRPEMGDAVLRYSTTRITNMPTSDSKYQPFFFDLYRRQGANYWAREAGTDSDASGDRYALDINYFSFDFNTLGTEPFSANVHDNKGVLTTKYGSDALFIRLVQDTAP